MHYKIVKFDSSMSCISVAELGGLLGAGVSVPLAVPGHDAQYWSRLQ